MRIRSARITCFWAALAAFGVALAGAPGSPVASAGAAEVPGFTGTWLESALQSQYDLGSDMAFKNAPLLGTHNSFNSRAELGNDVSLLEINQTQDLTTQLDFGIRSLELDLHPDPFAGAPGRPIVCHTDPRNGCTVVKELDPILAEVSDWLRAEENSQQVVLLYLQDDLDGQEMHDDAAAIIKDELGNLVYRPAEAGGASGAGGCKEAPSELTRDDVLEAGAQVLIVSGCGEGRAWRSQAFSWERHLESRPHDFADYPDCGPDYKGQQYRSSLVRYYEDSLRAAGANADDGLTPENVAAMVRCGVDLLSFDRIEALDGRLESTVWSWGVDEPSRGRCALIRTSGVEYGRWSSKRCGGAVARPACRNRNRWTVGKPRLDLEAGARWCERHGAKLAVPRTGFENQKLLDAMEDRATTSALLGIQKRGGEWTPLDSRGG